MRIFWNIRQWWRNHRCPPAVMIRRSGQRTQRPQVHVSVASIRGTQGVYTFDANAQGEASATMYGRGLAEIAGLRLVDERQLDDCSRCHGARGGVKGNENVIDGNLVCDYCHADDLTASQGEGA